MKKALLLLLALTSTAFASNNQPIEEAFQRYWNAYARKDYARLAAEVLPSDLEELKTALLPVFLATQANPKKEVQEMVTAFFGRTVGKSREALSPAEVFAGLQRIIAASDPQLFDALKDARTTIVFVRRSDAENAEVHYQVTLHGESEMESESFTLRTGRWWARLKEPAQETAAEFKAMFSTGS
jgi:hypothetical protein